MVDLMGQFGGPQAGGFFDDAPEEDNTQVDMQQQMSTSQGFGSKMGFGSSSGDAVDGEYHLFTFKHYGSTGKTESSAAPAKTPNPFSTFQDAEDPGTYEAVYERLKEDIDGIEENRRDIENLTVQLVQATQADAEKDIMGKLDGILSTNATLTKRIKDQLTEEKDANDKFAEDKPGSTVAQWRKNQLNSCTRRFKTTANEFQQALNKFNTEIRKKQKRQIVIVDTEKKLSEDEVEELAADPERATQYIQQSFQMVDISDAMLDRLAEIEARHEGMQKIAQGMEELHQMWQELHILITEQQEMLDNIENNVVMTKDYVASATVHLQKAEVHQKRSRKMAFCLMCLCFVILIIVIFSVLGGTGSFSSS